jgi:hypothetical protein
LRARNAADAQESRSKQNFQKFYHFFQLFSAPVHTLFVNLNSIFPNFCKFSNVSKQAMPVFQRKKGTQFFYFLLTSPLFLTEKISLASQRIEHGASS